MRACLCCALLLLASVEAATAQRGPLYGITDVQILGTEDYGPLGVERLGDDARRCNVDYGSIDASARRALDNSRLKVVNPTRASAPGSFDSANLLFVVVQGVRHLSAEGCIAIVEVFLVKRVVVSSFSQLRDIALTSSPEERLRALAELPASADARIWGWQELLTGSPGDFGTHVSAVVTRFTEQLIAAWVKDNPRP